MVVRVLAKKNSPFCFVSWHFYCSNFRTIDISGLNVKTANKKQLFGTSNHRDFRDGSQVPRKLCVYHFAHMYMVLFSAYLLQIYWTNTYLVIETKC